MTTKNYQTILFDLDGTLLDTARDLEMALNSLLIASGKAPVPTDQIREVVSQGTDAILRLGFQDELHSIKYDTMRFDFLMHYRNNLSRYTKPFAGINNVLETLKQQQISWGIVTNKPGWLTEPLVQEMQFAYPPVCIVSGDTLVEKKPDPKPLIHACQLIGCAATNCIYVGDAETDILAGKNAGMKALVANYGYIARDQNPLSWNADGYLSKPEDLINFLSWMKI